MEVDIDGSFIAAGGVRYDSGAFRVGSIALFDRQGNYLGNANRPVSSIFSEWGYRFALDGDTLVVGDSKLSYSDGTGFHDQGGKTYIFAVPEPASVLLAVTAAALCLVHAKFRSGRRT
jgi:hypothetical protein